MLNQTREAEAFPGLSARVRRDPAFAVPHGNLNRTGSFLPASHGEA
jgi:hypothetical protein